MARKKPLLVLDKLDQAPGESLEHYYRRLAKQADQRLVRLEAYAHDTGYKNVKNWAYKRALKDIEHWSGEGSMRFNTSPPKTAQQLEAKIRDIRQFLEAPTSTKAGITKVYKGRAESINRSQGTNLTWQQLADFFENDKFKEMMQDTEYGSGDTLRVYSERENGNIKVLDENGNEIQNDDKINKAIATAIQEDNLDQIIQVDDELIQDTIIEMLKNNDLKPEDLIKR